MYSTTIILKCGWYFSLKFLVAYILGESSVVVVDQSLRGWDAMIRLLKANLIQAQARMKG